jgi:hypothetical protein
MLLIIVLSMLAVGCVGVFAIICGLCRSAAAGDRAQSPRDRAQQARGLRLVS